MLLFVSRQTFLWPLDLVTLESEVEVGSYLGRTSAAVSHTPLLWS